MGTYLSVIIPAYNEAERIRDTLTAVDLYLIAQPFESEIVVADDGSTDGTAALVETRREHIQQLRILRLPHLGKGAAVQSGMLAASGEIRLFMDADGSTSIHQLDALLLYLTKGNEMIVGSRLVEGTEKKTKQNIARELLGWAFRTLIAMLIRTGVTDTQNGFKLFSKHAALSLFAELHIKEWAFDVELLVRANKSGIKIVEVPIVWVNDGRSRIRFSHMVRMLFDVLKIRRQYS